MAKESTSTKTNNLSMRESGSMEDAVARAN